MNTSQYTLTVTARDASIKPSVLRTQGFTPAVIYGNKAEPLAVSVNSVELGKVLHKAGLSSLVDLTLPDGSQKAALFKEAHHHPVDGSITHIDLYAVNMTEKIKADIALVFENEAPALTTYEAILVTNKDSVEVECLPRDLPHDIKVDLSVLVGLEDNIKVSDLKVASGVEILDDPEEIIVLVSEQREEEAEPEVTEADAVAAVEATAEKPADEPAAE